MTKRVKTLGKMTQKIKEGYIEAGDMIEGNDSIAKLAQTINEIGHSWEKRLIVAEQFSEMGRISARLAHEIRTPLTSIKLLLQALEMELNLEMDQKEDFSMIEKEIQRLDDVVTQYLNFTKFQVFDPKPIDLNRLFHSIMVLINAKIDPQKHRICLNLSKDSFIILGNESQLFRVFLNLITNAIEAMPSGGIVLINTLKFSGNSHDIGTLKKMFTLDGIDTSKDFVQITVADSGPGLLEKDQIHIFEPFFTTKNGGTGLGLSIASTIIQRHKGVIVANNLDEGGCIFRVLLPL